MTRPFCFVIQKMGDPFFDELYDDIEIAVANANADCFRADQILGATPILEKIKENIENAAICIAEVSLDDCPNVFFEIGYALRCNPKKTFILWDQKRRPDTKGLPFDIKDLQGIPYDSTKTPHWRKELRSKLTEHIKFHLTEVPKLNHSSDTTTIAELLNTYLLHCKTEGSKRTHEWYTGHIKTFLNYLGNNANEPAISLTHFEVRKWLLNQNWSDTYKRGAITALQVPYNWALENKYITENPLKDMVKPKATKRNNPMPADVFKSIVSQMDENDSFRDILRLMWNLDCTPEEIRSLKGEYIDLEKQCIRMPSGVGRAGKRPRTIPLNSEALEILKKLKEKRPPQEYLFLNTRGGVWTKFALCNRLYRYSKAMGKSYALSDCRNGAMAA
jgi:integrase